MDLLQPYPATEEQRARSQRWATKNAPARPEWNPTTRPPADRIPKSAFDATTTLYNLIGSVVPGATIANPKLLDFDGTRTTLHALLVPPQEPFSLNYVAQPYTFVLANGGIESFKPMQETLVPVPRQASSRPPLF